MKKIAIVYLAHDGFTSLYTGVGTVARDFLLSFPEVNKILRGDNKNLSLELFMGTIKYNKKCFGYSEEVKKGTVFYTKKYKNIHLVELINGSGGEKSYGSIDLWKNACISAATFVYTLLTSQKFNKVIVVCVDTPFAQVANYFFDQYQDSNIDFVWLPQSTVMIHKIDSALGKKFEQNSYLKLRYTWEKGIVDLARKNPQVKIACVSKFIKKHLIKAYFAKRTSLINLQNGLYFKRLNKYKVSQDKIASILKKMGVPLDRPLIFSFGRAESYKGLDLVIKNAKELMSKKNYYLLIIASPYSIKDSYVSRLNKLIREYPKNSKIVYDLDFLIPHFIMQWKNTMVLALLSRAEPFGLIPTEARYYRNKNLTLLVSDLDGFSEQIKDGIDGFKTKLNNRQIRLKFNKIAKLGIGKKSIIAQKGYDKAIRLYDQIKINSNFIKKYL